MEFCRVLILMRAIRHGHCVDTIGQKTHDVWEKVNFKDTVALAVDEVCMAFFQNCNGIHPSGYSDVGNIRMVA